MTRELLYLDPWSGISGDMTLAALLDAAGPEGAAALRAAVASLGLEGVEVSVSRVDESGIACTRVEVLAEKSPPLRHLDEMLDVIDQAAVSDAVKARSRAAISRLAEVEAAVHGTLVDDIHFHEVGAADTLVDVMGTFVLVEALGVDEVMVGTIPVGGGSVEIAHGRMGVPAPATVALLSGYEAMGGPEMRELTTPTGALLVGQLRAKQGPLPAMTVRAVGYGAGTMKLHHGPNVLRVVLGEVPDDTARSPRSAGPAVEGCGEGLEGASGGVSTVVELQTNVDDVSPEMIGYTLLRLREAGALDAWTVAAHMKKGRPGVVVHVLVEPASEGRLVDLLFAETGTLGVRRYEMSRYVAARGSLSVQVGGGEVAVKWGRWGERVSFAPEYEEAARVAAVTGTPLREVMAEATEAARRLLQEGTAP